MRRRDLIRGAGLLAVLAAAPVVAGCAGPRNDPADTNGPAVPSAITGNSAASSAPANAATGSAATASAATASAATGSPAPASTAAASTAAGGAVVRGAGTRRPPPASATAGRMLPAAAALYRAALPGTGNALLSPYSIVSALGMLSYGARGATAAALTKALGGDADTVAGWLTAGDAALAAAVAASRDARYQQFGSGEPTVIDPANALFLRRGERLNPPFLDALARGYGVGVRQVDFARSEQAKGILNRWVGERTRGLVPELVPAGFVDRNTVLVLVNALYLKAGWVNQFQAVRSATFRTATGSGVAVALMTREDKMNYVKTADWEAVSIPLVSDLAMTAIVPRPGSFAAVAARLDAKLLAQATSGEEYQVKLAMPGFRTDTPTDLEAPLRDLGLGVLFERPDLSGIAGAPGALFVSGAVHQARIAVDHHGIEAAAATAVGVAMSAPGRSVELQIDRPFFYLIHDTATTTPLFLGRMTDPTAC